MEQRPKLRRILSPTHETLASIPRTVPPKSWGKISKSWNNNVTNSWNISTKLRTRLVSTLNVSNSHLTVFSRFFSKLGRQLVKQRSHPFVEYIFDTKSWNNAANSLSHIVANNWNNNVTNIPEQRIANSWKMPEPSLVFAGPEQHYSGEKKAMTCKPRDARRRLILRPKRALLAFRTAPKRRFCGQITWNLCRIVLQFWARSNPSINALTLWGTVDLEFVSSGFIQAQIC